MMRIGHPDIEIIDELPDKPLITSFDRRLISQAVTNIVKNATEAISAVPEAERGPGRITVSLDDHHPAHLVLAVTDNGKGFPAEGRQRLLEPYMTTREGGTGLGLPIVAKILEEHGGGMELLDNPSGLGGQVLMWIPKEGAAETRAAMAEPRRAVQ
jgi:two-component system nitrogen regulation sensor histidine kinase NtrY